MFKPLTHEKRARWNNIRRRRCQLLTLETKCFYLHSDLQRLECRAKASAVDDRQFRRERMQIRHDLEILKIEIEQLQRYVQPLLHG